MDTKIELQTGPALRQLALAKRMLEVIAAEREHVPDDAGVAILLTELATTGRDALTRAIPPLIQLLVDERGAAEAVQKLVGAIGQMWQMPFYVDSDPTKGVTPQFIWSVRNCAEVAGLYVPEPVTAEPQEPGVAVVEAVVIAIDPELAPTDALDEARNTLALTYEAEPVEEAVNGKHVMPWPRSGSRH